MLLFVKQVLSTMGVREDKTLLLCCFKEFTKKL